MKHLTGKEICCGRRRESSSDFVNIHTWHRFLPRRDTCLSVNGDYVKVWCVTSATHVPRIHRSPNKIPGIRGLLPYFWSPIVYCVYIVAKHLLGSVPSRTTPQHEKGNIFFFTVSAPYLRKDFKTLWPSCIHHSLRSWPDQRGKKLLSMYSGKRRWVTGQKKLVRRLRHGIWCGSLRQL
jgi:hypothetical protein